MITIFVFFFFFVFFSLKNIFGWISVDTPLPSPPRKCFYQTNLCFLFFFFFWVFFCLREMLINVLLCFICARLCFFFFVLLYFVCIICAERERGRNEREKNIAGREKKIRKKLKRHTKVNLKRKKNIQ